MKQAESNDIALAQPSGLSFIQTIIMPMHVSFVVVKLRWLNFWANLGNLGRAFIAYVLRYLSLTLFTGIPVAISLLVTLIIFANSYELVFNQELPIVSSVDAISINNVLPYNAHLLGHNRDSAYIGGFGTPTMLEIPESTLHIPLIPGKHAADGWLARVNAGQYIVYAPSRKNSLGTTVIYMRQSWRTIPNPQDFSLGETISLDTNKQWRYKYVIDDIETATPQNNYIIDASHDNKLILVAQNETSGVQYIISATMAGGQPIQ